jgi:hypothetical protein
VSWECITAIGGRVSARGADSMPSQVCGLEASACVEGGRFLLFLWDCWVFLAEPAPGRRNSVPDGTGRRQC